MLFRSQLLVENLDPFEVNMSRLDFVPQAYAPEHVLIDASLVEAVHAAGMKLVTWTVNEVERMQALIALGVDAIITDYPDRAATLLGR